MNLEEWQSTFNQSSFLPLVVEFWAPWCGPCRVMAPAFERVAQKYAGQVTVVRINADDSPEVVQALGILGIPTVLGFKDGREVFRRVGLQSESALNQLFAALVQGRVDVGNSLGMTERLLRLVSGTALLAWGWFNESSVILMVVGAGLMFSAVYDRCPVWRALTTWVKSRLQSRTS